jgi:Domain of unknown function (DUF4234)
MAYELQIRNSQERVKIRSPWAVALLPIVTLGIYHLVWWYRINRELRDYGRAKGYDLVSPALSSWRKCGMLWHGTNWTSEAGVGVE